jgi:hypothetical protein
MSPWTQLLYRALASPYGIIVVHEKPEVALTRFRVEARGDPALSRVSITRLADEPEHIYLVSNTPKDPPDAQG